MEIKKLPVYRNSQYTKAYAGDIDESVRDQIARCSMELDKMANSARERFQSKIPLVVGEKRWMPNLNKTENEPLENFNQRINYFAAVMPDRG